MSDVREAVDGAVLGAKDTIGYAGSTLAFTIDNIRADYSEALDETIDQLDATSTLKIRELERVVGQFTATAVDAADDLAAQAQQLANTLPLANTAPQITDFAPRMLALDPDKPSIQLQVDGNFHSTLPEGEVPRLLLDGTRLEPPQGAITGELIFDIPTELLPEPSTTTIMTTTLHLEVPFRSTVLKRDKVGEFDLLVSVLPTSVGTLTLERRRSVDYRVSSGVLRWPANGVACGVDAQYDNGDETTVCEVRPSDGASIDISTVNIVVADARGSQGDYWNVKRLEETADRVAYEVWADDHLDLTSLDGKIFIFIEYEQYTVESREETTPAVPLTPPAWGAELVVPVERDERVKLTWTRFDGAAPVEIVGNYLDDPFLRVTVDGAWWRIRAVISSRTVSTGLEVQPTTG